VVIVVAFVAATVFVASVAAASAQERIAEIRVHGNHTTPDSDILMLSGLHVGDEATDARLMEAARVLRTSGRFEDVDVKRRYLSIADPSQILVMIVVDELAGTSVDHPIPGPWKRMRAAGMWMPVLNYADGYGFTYGARLAWIKPLGDNSRASVPLTWGGERRAGLQLERRFGGDPDGLPALRLIGGGAVFRRVNPYYDTPDTRLEARIRAEHPFTSWLRVGGNARTAHVSFSREELTPVNGVPAIINEDDRHDAVGADVTIDTRVDPSFPRNAVYASLGLERLSFERPLVDTRDHARRGTADLRGYVGAGPTVLGLRALFLTSNTPLPQSEQALLGGGDTLRGYPAGHAANDNLAAVSAEVRVPLTSPLNVGRFGVKGFVDWGTTWAAGARFGDQRWDRGIGGGVYFGAGPLMIDVALAWPREGGPRGHFGMGVTF
jgi:outer membrane protein assembly factor BamA